jgi:23S rRNA pseudouridine1911/1915/1917 synthase
MTNEFDIVVPPGQKRERIDVFLTKHVENATRTKVQRAIREGNVLVNGLTVRSSHKVNPGESIRIILPNPPLQHAIPECIPLDILYEDDDLLVVNKPAGMVTHPAHGNYSGTLVNALLYHCRNLSSVGEPARPGIIHRLDKDTSGLMVIAKTDVAHAKLARQFAQRTIKREYWAIVWGALEQSSGIVEAHVGRSKADRKKMAVIAGGKHAVTGYRVLRQFEYLSLLRLRLGTGRTHQIRVHLAHISHPVFGDPTYNGRRILYGPRTGVQKAEVQQLLGMIQRQALHAKTLGFVHPATGKDIYFDSALPADMSAVLERLQGSHDVPIEGSPARVKPHVLGNDMPEWVV